MAATTIFSLSSGAARSGVAVVRVSGDQAPVALSALAGTLPEPRRAELRALVDPNDGRVLDRGLVLWFPAPASFTGEPVVEFQIHGGRAVVTAVLEALGTVPGLRPAEAGEYVRRAFDNGKLDLTEVEGLADLINAETEIQRRQALRQMDGALGALYENWRSGLLKALAGLEADLEFPDDDLDPLAQSDFQAEAVATARRIDQEIKHHLDDHRRGERLRDGVYVALVGPPNAGKSSLLNALAQREAAIVSEVAGTTRDVIEVHLDLAGYPVILADTAGLHDGTAGPIEAEGMVRARHRATAADIKVVLCDAVIWPKLDQQTLGLLDDTTYVVVNKIDLLKDFSGVPEIPPFVDRTRGAWPLSVATGVGMETFLSALTTGVGQVLEPGGSPSLTRIRHRDALEVCRSQLAAVAGNRLSGAGDPELLAEDLRLAARALGRITGRVGVEDVLDLIFKDFCIGK